MLSQVGLPPDEIQRRLTVLRAVEPNPDFSTVPALPRPLPGLTVKLHSPPRVSKKVGTIARPLVITWPYVSDCLSFRFL
jgi:hypothetical protein